MSAIYHQPPTLFGKALDLYLVNGWFRAGQYIYTLKTITLKGNLYYPVRIRLPLKDYEFRKSLRKVWKKNQRFKTVIQEATITEEKEDLYQKFILRFDDYIAPTLRESLLDGGLISIYDTYEAAVYDGDQLIAVSYFDLGHKAMASIMGVFDPEYSAYSLGFYTMLAEIAFGKKQGFLHYYPGYVIPSYPKFDYKLRIGDCEFYVLDEDVWYPLEKIKKSRKHSKIIKEIAYYNAPSQ